MTPRATYRLQFGPAFGFAAAAAIAPYLAGLGVSHVYAAPIFAARAGSTHGYDVTDPTAINPELGGEAGFRTMARAFRDQGLRLILDIVPNHMGVGGDANPRWLDVLRWGPKSRFARWFDIDWSATDPRITGKVLVPILGQSYRDALVTGALELRFDAADGSFSVWAHDTHKLPLCPKTYGRLLPADAAGVIPPLADAEPQDPRWKHLAHALAADAPRMHAAAAALRGQPGDAASWGGLEALIGAQYWRPAKFSLANDSLNYRRFFAVSDLVGVRVEDPEVFEETHRLIFSLFDEGLVHGLRVDHVDGLRDPKTYLHRLRQRLPQAEPLLVEKILAPDERLPPDWGVDGTTGYEFANLLVGLLVDPAGSAELSRGYAAFTGLDAAPAEVVLDAKREVQQTELRAEFEALLGRLLPLADRDVGRASLGRALAETVAALDVYRTYADRAGIRPEDRRRIVTAVEAARRRCPDLDPEVFDFLAAVLTLTLPRNGDALEAVLRFQQLTGPVMAKGLEDTALYRFNRLLALNEVGGRPDRFGVTLAAFHAANAERLRTAPRMMLTTSTHDTKRGEDARARIVVLSRHASNWADKVRDWHDLLVDPALPIERNDEFAFYQILLGSWPFEWRLGIDPSAEALAEFGERLGAAMLKSVREAGIRTRWTFGDPGYEAAIGAFVARALDRDGTFLSYFRAFEAELAEEAAGMGLAQLILKLTLPGVPDIYQGSELWEQSMVDPDNRRAVDFGLRSTLLNQPGTGEAVPLTAPRAKFDVTRRLLALRRSYPRLFSHGSYEPLHASDPEASVCAFTRHEGDVRLVVAVPFHGLAHKSVSAPPIELPPVQHPWRNVLTDGSPDPANAVPPGLVLVSAA